MLIDIYTVGKSDASFEPIPGSTKQALVVPAGSEVMETRAGNRRFRMLFVPTKDPRQRCGWLAYAAYRDAMIGRSVFRLIPRSLMPRFYRG